jgi:DNA-binding MarR family transcriptional regulator
MKIEDEIKQREFKNERQKALINVMFTSNFLSTVIARHLKQYQLSTQQFNVLRILRGQYPNPIRANDLQGRMMDRMSNVSRIIEKLRVKNLLERQICEQDRRAVDVKITGKGLSLLKELDIVAYEWEAQLNSLSNKELNTLNHLLDKIRN